MKNTFTLIAFTLLFVVKSFSQTHEWATTVGSLGPDIGKAIASDHLGNSYTTGYFTGSVDFDPGQGTTMLNCTGDYEFFVKKSDISGNLQWARSFGSSVFSEGHSICADNSGNVLITGLFEGSTDFDPGPGSFLLTSNGYKDIFILELDGNGNFVWAKNIGSSGYELSTSICVNQAGDIFVAGQVDGSADLDPGPGIQWSTGSSFMVSLDPGGNFLWAKDYSALGRVNIRIDGQGNIFTCGIFDSTVDFDPGPGTHYLSSIGGLDAFIQKSDHSGNLLWAGSIGSQFQDDAYDLSVDGSGNVFLMGFSGTGNSDYDPGTGLPQDVVHFSQPGGNFIVKIDSSGGFRWVRCIPGSAYIGSHPIDVDRNGYVYVSGFFANTLDFDPGPGSAFLSSPSTYSTYLEKFDPSGNFIWAEAMLGAGSGTGEVHSFGISVDDSLNIHITGHLKGTGDFDPGPGVNNLTSVVGGEDIFEVLFSQDHCSNITLAMDSAADATCLSSGYGMGHALNGTPPFSYLWNTNPPDLDSIAIFSTGGIYSLAATDAVGCSRTSSLVIAGPSTINGFDLRVNPPIAVFVPGFTIPVYLDAFNDGCVPASGDLKLVIDDSLTYISSIPPPDLISGDTLTWNFSNITYNSPHLKPEVRLNTNTGVIVPQSLCLDLFISPSAGDQYPNNNFIHHCTPSNGSYDPNHIYVFPRGECDAGLVMNSEKLTYTITFQNTGNYVATNVFLMDTLDADLDVNTLRVLGKSHETLMTELLPGNILKFRFDNIMLPDSSSNEPQSHGYVMYEISPQSGLADGTIISNQADIYFDFNLPVTTNHVSNTVVQNISVPDLSVTQITNGLHANQNGASYLWINCSTGYPVFGAMSQDFYPVSVGDYAVTIYLGYCTDTSDCYSVTTVENVAPAEKMNWSIHPNPAGNTAMVQIPDKLNAGKLFILNVEGVTVMEMSIASPGFVQLDLSSLAGGVYFVGFTNDGNTSWKKLIKVRN